MSADDRLVVESETKLRGVLVSDPAVLEYATRPAATWLAFVDENGTPHIADRISDAGAKRSDPRADVEEFTTSPRYAAAQGRIALRPGWKIAFFVTPVPPEPIERNAPSAEQMARKVERARARRAQQRAEEQAFLVRATDDDDEGPAA